MSTLVVQTHPLEDSFNAEVLNSVVAGLTAAGVDHTVCHLYASQDDPSLSGVRRLVCVYPTWWGGPPARLLAWLQGVAEPYVDGAKRGKASPFSGVEDLTIVTTHGSSKLMNTAQGEPGRQTWERVVLPLCAKGAKFSWLSLYKIDRTTVQERQAFLAEVEARFTSATALV